MNSDEYVICPCCGETARKTKYCAQCGSSLAEAKTVCSKNPETSLSCRKALSDEGLYMLANACKKTVATVGGDGYSEIVLYKDESTGKYWIHTYSKYVYMKEEAHASYAAAPELAEKVLDYIEKEVIPSWEESRNLRPIVPSMCGGDFIIRFRYNGEIIRLATGSMPNVTRYYSELGNLLYSGATEEARRYADE